MSRARQRRIRGRKTYLARLAQSDQVRFDTEIRQRMKSWVRDIRDSADDLSAKPAHTIADEAVREIRELAVQCPGSAPAAAKVAITIRHTAMKEVAKVVEPRMAKLTTWPDKNR